MDEFLTDEEILAIVSAAPAGPTAESEWLYVCRKVEAAVLSASAGEKKDAERWRAMRQHLVAVDFAPDMGGGPVAMFDCYAYSVMAGSKGADSIADALIEQADSKSNQEQSTNKEAE